MNMERIKNGRYFSTPPELNKDVAKVVVIGERHVGKSSFIHQYHRRHQSDILRSNNGVSCSTCKFNVNGSNRKAEIFEIPLDSRLKEEQRTLHCRYANVIVLMYAIDLPVTLVNLISRWLPEVRKTIGFKKIPMVLVGNKKDARNNSLRVEMLAARGKYPVTKKQAEGLLENEEIKDFCEISAINVSDVDEAFDLIFKHVQ